MAYIDPDTLPPREPPKPADSPTPKPPLYSLLESAAVDWAVNDAAAMTQQIRERDEKAPAFRPSGDALARMSIAISLKRIADNLEPVTMTAEAHQAEADRVARFLLPVEIDVASGVWLCSDGKPMEHDDPRRKLRRFSTFQQT